MNRRSSRTWPLLRPRLLLFWLVSAGLEVTPAMAPAQTQASQHDYSEPALLTGTVYEKGSGLKKVLFKVRRTATRTNETVQALIEFRTVGGELAACERMTYQAGRLVSCQLDQLQSGAQGGINLAPEANPSRLLFEFNPGSGGRRKTDSETLQKDTLVNDMIGPFVQANWDTLSRGAAAKFRYVALERAETVGFKLVRDAETTWRGQPAVRLKMEPTSLVIAALVDTLYFTVEQAAPHRVLEYDGRVTPKIERAGKWKDLDAVTVYDWPLPKGGSGQN
jgi:hypothetical protein